MPTVKDAEVMAEQCNNCEEPAVRVYADSVMGCEYDVCGSKECITSIEKSSAEYMYGDN